MLVYLFAGLTALLAVLLGVEFARRRRGAPQGLLYQRVFERIHTGIKVWRLEDPNDPGSLRLIASNAAAAEATGVPVEQVLGKTIAEGFPQAVPQGIAAKFAEVAKTGVAKSLGEITYSDARVREGIYHVVAFPLGDRTVGVAFENVTKRRLREMAIERKASYVNLLKSVAMAANDTRDAHTAFQRCLDEMCAFTKWPIGHVYVLESRGSDTLVSTELWHVDDVERFAKFREATRRLRFQRGTGLPGEVLATGKAAWRLDIDQNEDNYPRLRAAGELGVKTGFAFPVLVGDEVVAVLEFFTPAQLIIDEPLLEVMEHVGTQLGRVVERERAAARSPS